MTRAEIMEVELARLIGRGCWVTWTKDGETSASNSRLVKLVASMNGSLLWFQLEGITFIAAKASEIEILPEKSTLRFNWEEDDTRSIWVNSIEFRNVKAILAGAKAAI